MVHVSGKRFGVRLRAGTDGRCGGFHNKATDALTAGGFFGFVFESSTPCLAFENSSFTGYARPATRNTEALYSVSLPDLTQASITGLRVVERTTARVLRPHDEFI